MTSIVDDRGFNQGFEWNPTQEVRMRRRAQAIVETLDSGAVRVLEWGCGTGELAHFIATRPTLEVTGVDLCAPFIEQASARFGSDRLHYRVVDLGSAAARSELGANWDAVVGNGILHHLYYRIGPALESMRQMITPGGQLVFWEPNLWNPYVFATFSFQPLRHLTKLEPDEMAFTPRWVERELAQAGFTDVQVSFRDFLVPNLPFSLVPAVTRVGDQLEQLPGLKRLAQSLFISARRPR